jgi:hypothetical protein
LAPRSRKRAGRSPSAAGWRIESPPAESANRPAAAAEPPTPGSEPPLSRGAQRDAEARALLEPLAPGERPRAVTIGAIVAALLGLVNLIAYAAGLKIAGKQPAAGGIVVFSLLMLTCAAGMWRMWYGAVLGFMALLAIIATIFALLLIEASNLLGVLVPVLVITGSGFLFFKLVRVLSRIQMPTPPGR